MRARSRDSSGEVAVSQARSRRAGGLRPRITLTRRILFINVLALAILVGGVFYLDQFRQGLLAARLDALTTQAKMIAAALGEAALVGRPEDPELDAELARQIVRRVVPAAGTRARLFAQDESLLADSRLLIAAGRQVELRPLPPPGQELDALRLFHRAVELITDWLPRRRDFQPYVERVEQRASDYPEAIAALHGDIASAVRANDDDTLILSVSVPVQRFKRVLGALMLSAGSSDIDAAVRAERLNTLKVFAVAVAVTALLSLILAGTIARPIRRLAAAAERIRTGHGRPVAVPDFGNRRDEIGDLAIALKDMTETLYGRVDAIAAFAADVAHELRNPLTSLRSAVETMARTTDPEVRERLMRIIRDDVGRLDRLISDISDASRIDAELSRAEQRAVDIGAMVKILGESMHSTDRGEIPEFIVDVDDSRDLTVLGIEARLGQVLRNLIDNAISFSPPDGAIRISAQRRDGQVLLTVEDQGPGLPEQDREAVFDRFYSARPEGEAFGTHSGLGLSISRQIVDAHGGEIMAENRLDADGSVVGAKFVIRLPAPSANN